MVAAFLVTWVPYSLMAIVKIVSALDDQVKPMSDMQSMAFYLPALLAKSSIIYNPIIYAVFNTQVCLKFFYRPLKCLFEHIRMEKIHRLTDSLSLYRYIPVFLTSVELIFHLKKNNALRIS